MNALRHGRWQDVLADVQQVDVLVTDPPYSKRTHEGFDGSATHEVSFDHLTAEDVGEFGAFWADRVRNWILIWTDHVLYQAFEAALFDWYVFAPVAWVVRDACPRLAGDGPTCSTQHLLVARPRRRLPAERTGSRPGHYIVTRPEPGLVGAKPLEGVKAVLRDYALPGDLIADPYAGTGTTLRAARELGMSWIGAEVDPERFEAARRRIEAPYTPALF